MSCVHAGCFRGLRQVAVNREVSLPHYTLFLSAALSLLMRVPHGGVTACTDVYPAVLQSERGTVHVNGDR